MTALAALDHDYGSPADTRGLDAAAERKWLLQYLPLVKRIVRQLALQASQVMDREDMEQIGLMGLLECLRRYGEPDEQFGRFAALRIRGAILDELRRQDWRPRQVRQCVLVGAQREVGGAHGAQRQVGDAPEQPMGKTGGAFEAGFRSTRIGDTDWRQVLALYDQMYAATPTPVVALNRAVALAEVEGPQPALAVVDGLPLEGYHAFHATRADLLRRLGRGAEASEAYGRALELAANPAERSFLERRRAEVS